MTINRLLLCLCAAVPLAGCFTTKPQASANLAEVIQRVRGDLRAANPPPGETAATSLTMSEAQIVLKITAEGGSGINVAADGAPIPLKVTYSASQSGSLENTITIKYSLPGTPANPGAGGRNPLDNRPDR